MYISNVKLQVIHVVVGVRNGATISIVGENRYRISSVSHEINHARVTIARVPIQISCDYQRMLILRLKSQI